MSLIPKSRQIKLENFQEITKPLREIDFFELPNGNVLVYGIEPYDRDTVELRNHFYVYETKTGCVLSHDVFEGSYRESIVSRTGKLVFFTGRPKEVDNKKSYTNDFKNNWTVVLYDPTTHEFIVKEKKGYLSQLRELQSGGFLCVRDNDILVLDQEGNTQHELFLSKNISFAYELKLSPGVIHYAYESDKNITMKFYAWDTQQDTLTYLGFHNRCWHTVLHVQCYGSMFHYLNDETILWVKPTHPIRPKDYIKTRVWNPKINEMRESEPIPLLYNKDVRMDVHFFAQKDGFLVSHTEKNLMTHEKNYYVYDLERNAFSKLDTKGTPCFAVRPDVLQQKILGIDRRGNLSYFDVTNRWKEKK